VEGIGDVNTVCNGRKRQLNSLRVVFNLHPGQTQRSLDRTSDGRATVIDRDVVVLNNDCATVELY
jgi:hypothetical protein